MFPSLISFAPSSASSALAHTTHGCLLKEHVHHLLRMLLDSMPVAMCRQKSKQESASTTGTLLQCPRSYDAHLTADVSGPRNRGLSQCSSVFIHAQSPAISATSHNIVVTRGKNPSITRQPSFRNCHIPSLQTPTAPQTPVSQVMSQMAQNNATQSKRGSCPQSKTEPSPLPKGSPRQLHGCRRRPLPP